MTSLLRTWKNYNKPLSVPTLSWPQAHSVDENHSLNTLLCWIYLFRGSSHCQLDGSIRLQRHCFQGLSCACQLCLWAVDPSPEAEKRQCCLELQLEGTDPVSVGYVQHYSVNVQELYKLCKDGEYGRQINTPMTSLADPVLKYWCEIAIVEVAVTGITYSSGLGEGNHIPDCGGSC